jgi:hypothetical protein
MVDIYKLGPEAGQPDLQLAQVLKMLRDSYVFFEVHHSRYCSNIISEKQR